MAGKKKKAAVKRNKKEIRPATAVKVVEGMLNPGKSDKQALVEAGYSEYTATKKPQTITQHPMVQELFTKELLKAGVTSEKLAQVLAEGLNAQREVSFIFNRIVERMGLKGNALVEGMADEFTDDFISVPDFAVRHKYLETALKAVKVLEQMPLVHMNITGDVLMQMRRDELTEDELIRYLDALKAKNGDGEG